MRREALAFDREGVDVLTAIAVERGNQIGTDALRCVIALPSCLRVGVPGAAVAADRRARHRFDAARHHAARLATAHERGTQIDGFERRRTEAVDLLARHALRIVGGNRGHTAEVRALLADRRDAAENHVVDEPGVESVAIAHGRERLGGKLDRRDLVKAPVRAPSAARRAHVVVDIGVLHWNSPLMMFWRADKRHRACSED